MTITTTDAELEVYRPPDNRDGDPHATIDGHDIESLSFSERIGWRKDTGTLTLRNDTGQWTETISSGDELRVYSHLGTPEFDRLGTWGADSPDWGEFAWPGRRLLWAAMARSIDNDPEGPQRATLSLECEDFALGVLAKRKVFESFDDWPVRSIIQRLVDTYADELSVSIDDSGRLGNEATVAFDGKSLYDALDVVASRADAVIRTHGAHIHVEPFDLSSPTFDATPAHDFGLLNWSTDDDDLVNRVRVDGSRQPVLDDRATVDEQASYHTIIEDSITRFQIPTRKSELSAIELWTNPGGDDVSVTVRIQNDDDGEPVASGDISSDLARRELSHEFIADDGWTEFQLPDNNVRNWPWVLIEVDGGTLEIGVDSSGSVSRRVYFPVPVSGLREDSRSIRRYRRRDDVLDGGGSTIEEARQRATAELRRKGHPDVFIECEAHSHRMHTLRPGDIVSLVDVADHLEGDYLLIERDDAFEGKDIETGLTFQRVGSV